MSYRSRGPFGQGAARRLTAKTSTCDGRALPRNDWNDFRNHAVLARAIKARLWFFRLLTQATYNTRDRPALDLARRYRHIQAEANAIREMLVIVVVSNRLAGPDSEPRARGHILAERASFPPLTRPNAGCLCCPQGCCLVVHALAPFAQRRCWCETNDIANLRTGRFRLECLLFLSTRSRRTERRESRAGDGGTSRPHSVAGPSIDTLITPFTDAAGDEESAPRWAIGSCSIAGTSRPRRLLRRASLFKRRAAGTSRKLQLIAANIDTLFIVSSCNQDFNAARLERYLALAREAEVTPVIVLTKADLADAPEDYVGSRPGCSGHAGRGGGCPQGRQRGEPGAVVRARPARSRWSARQASANRRWSTR